MYRVSMIDWLVDPYLSSTYEEEMVALLFRANRSHSFIGPVDTARKNCERILSLFLATDGLYPGKVYAQHTEFLFKMK